MPALLERGLDLLLTDKRLLRSALLFFCLLILAPSSGMAKQAPSESELKAAFILNFAKLVSWPDAALSQSEERFRIAIHGDQELLKVCQSSLRDKKASQRRIEIIGVDLEQAADPMLDVQILYLAGADMDALQGILDLHSANPLLLVGENSEFCERGGSIALIEEQGRMSFEVNRKQEFASGLKINSRLLRIARRVLE